MWRDPRDSGAELIFCIDLRETKTPAGAGPVRPYRAGGILPGLAGVPAVPIHGADLTAHLTDKC